MARFSEIALVQGMSFLATAQEASSHNLANAATDGFKRTVPVSGQAGARFAALLDERLPTAHFETATSASPGDPQPTGEKQHLSIFEKDRYFALQRPDGSVYYARTGTQHIGRTDKNSETFYLVNGEGHAYLDPYGVPIPVSTNPSSVSIGEDGTLVNDDDLTEFGKIGRFADLEGRLQHFGQGSFVDPEGNGRQVALPQADLVDGTDPEVDVTRIRQGFLERSNVDVTLELVQMLTLQRSFEATQRALGSIGRIHQSFVQAVNQ